MSAKGLEAREYQGTAPCSLARAVAVVGERWTFFIIREALVGATRFSEFREALGIAPDVLTTRLTTLVDAGLMERLDYREAGQRSRPGYHLTEAGEQLALVISALQQWGDRWTPSQTPTSVRFRGPDGREARAGFIDSGSREVPPLDVIPERTATSDEKSGSRRR